MLHPFSVDGLEDSGGIVSGLGPSQTNCITEEREKYASGQQQPEGASTHGFILTEISGRTRDLAGLLDGDGLGQISRLVHVATAPHGDVIRQQLQRDNLEQRRQ